MRIILITLALALGPLGCGGDGAETSPDAAPEGTPSTRERLFAGPQRQPVVPAESAVSLGIRLPSSEDTASRERLPVTEGELAVGAGSGTLRLERLTLAFEDGVVSPERLPPRGLRITDVRVALAEPVEAQALWFGDGDEGYAQLEAALLLDWAVTPRAEPTGDPWPLAQQRIEGVTIDLHVSTDHRGNLVSELTASAPGVVWSWGPFAEIRDVELSLLAISTEAQP